MAASHGFFLGTRKFCHTALFVPHITERLHCEALLRCYYLSEIFTTSYINTGKFKFISSQNRIPSFVKNSNLFHLKIEFSALLVDKKNKYVALISGQLKYITKAVRKRKVESTSNLPTSSMQTDGHNEANSPFHNLANAPKNIFRGRFKCSAHFRGQVPCFVRVFRWGHFRISDTRCTITEAAKRQTAGTFVLTLRHKDIRNCNGPCSRTTGILTLSLRHGPFEGL